MGEKFPLYSRNWLKIMRSVNDTMVERIKTRLDKNIDDLIVVLQNEIYRPVITRKLKQQRNVTVISQTLDSIGGKFDTVFAPYIKGVIMKPSVLAMYAKSVHQFEENKGCSQSEQYTKNKLKEETTKNVSDKEYQKQADVWKEETTKLYKKHHPKWEKYRVRKGWFLSYKQKDGSTALVERLYMHLEGDNWYDMMHKRERTRGAMIKGICRRDKFICFVSPHYFASEWCCMELTVAMSLGKIIVPVYNQDERTAGLSLGFVPECFKTLKERDFVGLFMDMGPCLGQIKKIQASVAKGAISEFDDSEEENSKINLIMLVPVFVWKLVSIVILFLRRGLNIF